MDAPCGQNHFISFKIQDAGHIHLFLWTDLYAPYIRRSVFS